MARKAGRSLRATGASRILEKVGLFGRKRSGGRRRRRGSGEDRFAGSVDRYLLREPIGRGAAGEVWSAMDPRIGRAVAVKILNVPEGVTGSQREEWEKRFLREARAAGALSHPGIVAIHDVGMAVDGRPFIVMELVDGCSLDAVIRHDDGQPAPAERTCLEWGAQIAEALDAAHRRGIIHRDVKPANVLIDTEGRARIADFGIARLSESEMTRAGHFLGSPAFASPEQIRGAAVDGRSDLFSLGASLYLLLTGERPFRGEDLSSLAYAICHVEPAPPRRVAPRLSIECEAVLMKTLAKDPELRYRTGGELAEDLRAAADNRLDLARAAGPKMESTVIDGPDEESTGQAGDESNSGAGAGREPASGTRRRSAPHGRAALPVALAMATAVGILGGFIATRPGVVIARPAAAPAPARAVAADPWAQGAEILVHAVHDLAEGELTIWAGRRRLLRTPLRAAGAGPALSSGGAGSGGPSRMSTGEWSVRAPAGEHLLRVRVSGGTSGPVLTKELPLQVDADRRYRFHVRVKGPPGERLDLMWTSDGGG